MIPLTHIIALLIFIESGGVPNKVGDNGKSVGILQMKKVAVDQVNKILKEKRYSYADRLDPWTSCRMASTLLSYEIARYRKKKGTSPSSIEVLCAWQFTNIFRPATKPYQKKVKRQLHWYYQREE